MYIVSGVRDCGPDSGGASRKLAAGTCNGDGAHLEQRQGAPGPACFQGKVAVPIPSTYALSSFCRRKSTNALSAKLFPSSMPSFPRVLYTSDMGMRTRGVKCRAILSSRRRNESELYQLQELVLKCPRLRYAPPAAILHGTHCARGAYKSKTCACRLAFRGAVRCGAYLCRGGWVGRAPGGSPSTFPLRGRTKTSC